MNFLKIDFDFEKVHKIITDTNKLCAVFSGQWPHSSYCIPGGVTCDPTEFEINQAKNILESIKQNIKESIGDFENINVLNGDVKRFYETVFKNGFQNIGKGFNRFITLSSDEYVKNIKIINGVKSEAKIKYVKEEFQEKSYAKRVLYKSNFFETGPISRMLQRKERLIRKIYKTYKDSFLTRVIARVYEIEVLIKEIGKNLAKLDLSQHSFVKHSFKENAYGEISVEAARGSLIHKVQIENGKIKKYEIITPTQWNLSNGTKENISIIQKAIIGLKSKEIAELVFKSFDICSVCITH